MSPDHNHLVVDYGRRSYVFGLTWLTPIEDETPKKSVQDTLKRSVKSFDLALVRNDEYPQYALAAKADGVRPSAVSAAAALTAMIETDNWLYALEIEGSIWICNGKDGFILPDGDKVYDDPDEAKAEFLKLEPTRWKSLYVPQAWKEPGAFPDERSSLFQSDEVHVSRVEDIYGVPVQKWMRVNSLSGVAAMAKPGATAAALAAVAYFGFGFIFPSTPEPSGPDMQHTREMLAEKARQEMREKYSELDANTPWTTLPTARNYTEACISTLMAMPASIAGYNISALSCDPMTATAILDKTSSTFASWLHEWSLQNKQYEIDIAAGGESAFLVEDLPDLASRGNEALKNYPFISSVLTEASAIDQSKIEITDPVQYTYDEYPDYIPIYGQSEISIETQRPEAWMSTFDKISGVEINSISLDPTTMTYKLEGNIYVSNR